ncbi:MAG: prolipoprotein diacylglyceryl transferase [Candidatus Xenobia bacterium]
MHRILLFAGTPYQIYTYGVCLSIGILIASLVFLRRARFIGMDEDRAYELIGVFILMTTLGGRIMHICLEWPYYRLHPWQMFNLREGGLALYGAILGGSLTLLVFARLRQIPLLTLLDTAAPSCILAQGVGRVGCFFNGCCYGKIAPLAWGVFFRDAEPSVAAVPRYPTQIYEFVADLALFFLLLAWDKALQSRPRYRGQLFIGYIVLYGLIRFVIEFWRAEPIVLAGLTFAQVCSLISIAVAIPVGLMLRRQATLPATPALPVPEPASAGN